MLAAVKFALVGHDIWGKFHCTKGAACKYYIDYLEAGVRPSKCEHFCLINKLHCTFKLTNSTCNKFDHHRH